MDQNAKPSLLPYAPAAWAAVCGIASSGINQLAPSILIGPILAWLAADPMMTFTVDHVRLWLASKDRRLLLVEAAVAGTAAIGLCASSLQAVIVILSALALHLAALLCPDHAREHISQGLRVSATWLATNATLGKISTASLVLAIVAGIMTMLRGPQNQGILQLVTPALWIGLAIALFAARQPHLAVIVVIAIIADTGLPQRTGIFAHIGWHASMLVAALASIYWNI